MFLWQENGSGGLFRDVGFELVQVIRDIFNRKPGFHLPLGPFRLLFLVLVPKHDEERAFVFVFDVDAGGFSKLIGKAAVHRATSKTQIEERTGPGGSALRRKHSGSRSRGFASYAPALKDRDLQTRLRESPGDRASDDSSANDNHFTIHETVS